jgi:hypothetical protein
MTARMLLVLAVASAACGRDRSGGPRTADARATDSTLFGDDRARQGDSARTVPDLALLEQLVDEYEGLDVVMDELAGPTSASPVQKRAWKGDRHEDATKGRLLELLQAEFGERYHPRTPEGVARTTDSIAALGPDAGRRALDALVLDHHRRVAGAIAAGLPSVRSPRVREALVELHERLAQEIRKLGGPPQAGAPATAAG